MSPSRADLAVNSLVIFLAAAGLGLTLPILLFHLQLLGAPTGIATWVFALFSGCSLLSAPFWGALCDRIGRHTVVMLCAFGIALGYLWLLWSPSWPHVFASRALHGLCGGIMPAVLLMVSEETDPDRRPRLFGTIGACFAIGITFAPGFAALLLPSTPPLDPQMIPVYRTLFAISLGIASFMAIIATAWSLKVSLFRKRPWPPSSPPLPHAPNEQTTSPPSSRSLWAVLFLSVWIGGLFSAIESSFPLWAERILLSSPRHIGWLLFIGGLSNALTQGGLIRLLLRYWPSHVLTPVAWCLFLLGCGALLTATWPAGVVGIILMGAGMGLWTPLLQSAVSTTRQGSRSLGKVMGWYQATNQLARIVGSLWAGPAMALLGAHSVPLLILSGLALTLTFIALNHNRWVRFWR